MKTFKKTFVVTLCCLFLVTGCAEDQERMEVSRLESIMEEIYDLDELIRKSDKIVVGTVTDEEQFSEGATYKFTFTVKNELKGNVEAESIDVYEFHGDLEKGKEYILFLSYWESALYPNPVHTSINKNSLIEVKKNNLIGGEKFVGKKKKDEMIEYIKNSKEVNVFSKKEDAVIEKANNLAELILLSDQIIHLVPKEINAENRYVKNVEAKVIQTLKGSYEEEILRLNLPATIDLEKEYIVFLKENDGLGIATREGSVVSKKDEALWQQIMNEFAK
jgi:hypothetical protein